MSCSTDSCPRTRWSSGIGFAWLRHPQ
jgi:hypothetical protein